MFLEGGLLGVRRVFDSECSFDILYYFEVGCQQSKYIIL